MKSIKNSIIANALYIVAFGVICFLVIEILTGIFKITGVFWDYLSVFSLASFIVTGIIYYILTYSLSTLMKYLEKRLNTYA